MTILVWYNEITIKERRKFNMTPTPRCFMYDLLETINQANRISYKSGDIPFSLFACNDDMFLSVKLKSNGQNRTYNIGRVARIKIAEAIRHIKNEMMFNCDESDYEDFIDAITDVAAQV